MGGSASSGEAPIWPWLLHCRLGGAFSNWQLVGSRSINAPPVESGLSNRAGGASIATPAAPGQKDQNAYISQSAGFAKKNLRVRDGQRLVNTLQNISQLL